MPRSLIVEIIGDAKQFAAELDKAAGKTRQMSKAAGVAGLAIAGGLAYGLDKAVHSAVEGQASQARLEEAFKTSGESAATYRKQIDDTEAAQRQLGFTNIETRNSIASLEVATHSHTQALKDVAVAADIARFKHIGLEDASKTLTMAMAGSTRAVKQLGLQITPSTANLDALKEKYKQLGTSIPPAEEAQAKFLDKQQTAQQVIGLVSEKLHGQAAAFAGTAAGGAAQFHAQMEAIGENLGNTVLPALTVVSGALAQLSSYFAEHATQAKIVVAALGALAGTLIAVSAATKLYAAGQAIAAAGAKLFAAAQWLVNAALDANPIGIVVVALAALGVALYEAWQHSETFRRIVTDAFNAVKAAGADVANFITRTIPAAFQAVLGWLRSNWPIIATLVAGPFAPLVALATNAFGVRSALIGAFDAVRGRVEDAIHSIASTVRSVFGSIADIVNAAAKAIAGAVGKVVGAFQPVLNILNQVIGLAESAASAISKVASGGGILKGVSGILGHIGLAEGGIVTKPTLAIVGEAGPEAIVPLTSTSASLGPLGGGGGQITINVGPVQGSVDPAFARTLAAELAVQLRGARVPQLQQAIKAL